MDYYKIHGLKPMAIETSVALLNCIEKIYDLFLQNEKTK
jgi:hypothetical protein